RPPAGPARGPGSCDGPAPPGKGPAAHPGGREPEEEDEMSMKAEVHSKGNVTVVRVKGKITIGEGDIKLRDTIEGLLNEGKKSILLDLGEVTFMDSSGVGELVGCLTTVTNRGGRLKLLSLTKKIHDLLQVTKLITVFECFDDEAAAMATFS